MPETAENVAQDFAISRADQDAFALRSQSRAAAAQANGRLAREIAPVEIKDRKGNVTLVAKDEHPRQTTLEKLASLPTPFRKSGGTVTAGNASGVNDGAAAVLVASKRGVEKYGLKPLARIVGLATAGVAPRIMGYGPVPATQQVDAAQRIADRRFRHRRTQRSLRRAGACLFARAWSARRQAHVNPNGGAIAIGHPLGMSGARLALSAAMELQQRGGKRALATMCIGVGQGIAMAFEAV